MKKYAANNLNDFCGQSHLVGKNGALKKLIDKNEMKSSIFYGPAGTGKTSLARIICNILCIENSYFNAAIDNKQKLLEILDTSIMFDKYIIVIDEIHRMNKDKQDILLSFLESSKLIIIGITTINPYHSLNPAIRSRVHMFEFTHLSKSNIKDKLTKIHDKNYSEYNVDYDVYDAIVNNSNGDMRYAINQFDTLIIISNNNHISIQDFLNLNPKRMFLIDKNSDYYYDLISAFQKSIRGSDVDAALHYLAQLINLGDLEIITRRLLVITYEDIGLANPLLHQKIHTAVSTAKELGLPEATHPLAFAVIELSLSPKSNSSYKAIKNAIDDTKKLYQLDIPNNIKHHSINYIYPHNYNHWVKQQYLPTDLINKKYLVLKNNKYEQHLNLFYEKINKLKNNQF
ncbi:MAG: AAA family ATPase [Bacilli bacterium]